MESASTYSPQQKLIQQRVRDIKMGAVQEANLHGKRDNHHITLQVDAPGVSFQIDEKPPVMDAQFSDDAIAEKYSTQLKALTVGGAKGEVTEEHQAILQELTKDLAQNLVASGDE